MSNNLETLKQEFGRFIGQKVDVRRNQPYGRSLATDQIVPLPTHIVPNQDDPVYQDALALATSLGTQFQFAGQHINKDTGTVVTASLNEKDGEFTISAIDARPCISDLLMD